MTIQFKLSPHWAGWSSKSHQKPNPWAPPPPQPANLTSVLSALREYLGLWDPLFPKKSPRSFFPPKPCKAVNSLLFWSSPYQYHVNMLWVDLVLPEFFPHGENHNMYTLTEAFYRLLKQTFFSYSLKGNSIAIYRYLGSNREYIHT